MEPVLEICTKKYQVVKFGIWGRYRAGYLTIWVEVLDVECDRRFRVYILYISIGHISQSTLWLIPT